jgi:hypothetical protein
MLLKNRRLVMRALTVVAVAAALQVQVLARAQAPEPDQSRIEPSRNDWRTSGEPVIMAGAAYYPSGPTVFFDGAVMVRSGSFKGLSVYVDATRDPYNVVYVPVSGKLMRPYERREADRVADTVVAPVPSLPLGASEAGESASAVAAVETAPPAPATPAERAVQRARGPSHAAARSPGANRGIWIAFEDRIWILADRQPYPSRDLLPIGTYHGFSVFRDPARANQIFVSSGADSFLARYTLEERK